MKRIISLLAAFVMIVSSFCVGLYSASASDNEIVHNKLVYNINSDSTLTLNSISTYKGKDNKYHKYSIKNLVIPSAIKGRKVVAIRYFLNLRENETYDSLESVEIPDTVLSIENSFYNMPNLKKVKMGKNVKVFNNVFKNTPYRKANTKDGAFYIGKTLIAYEGTAKSFKIKEGTTAIADGALLSNYLENVTFPASLKTFGIYVADSVWPLSSQKNTIGWEYNDPQLRSKTKKLKSITVAEGNKYFASKDGVLYNKAMTKLIWYPSGKENRFFRVPDGVKTIEQYAFACNYNLVYVKLNSDLTKINKYAFYNTRYLKSLTVPKSVTTIGYNALGMGYWTKDIDVDETIKTKFIVYKNSGGDKYFDGKWEDEGGDWSSRRNGITISYPCSQHSYKTVKGKAATYFAAGYGEYQMCSKCGQIKGFTNIKKKTLATPTQTVKVDGKSLKVTYKKVKDATGFQLAYTVNGKTVTKTYTTAKTVTKTISKLKAGTYKVKIRAFIKQDGKTAYSAWTAVKSVKIK